jgi:hypothetical protein
MSKGKKIIKKEIMKIVKLKLAGEKWTLTETAPPKTDKKALSVDEVRQMIAESGKTRLADMVDYVMERNPLTDIKMIRAEARDIKKNSL